MSQKTPAVTGEELIRVLLRLGFTVLRKRGSHHFLTHPDGRGASIPVHARQELKRGLLSDILRDVGVTPDELRKLL